MRITRQCHLQTTKQLINPHEQSTTNREASMSFTGDLEHLPIVDIIQLLHSTRKTGTLCLTSPKGESQLVFDDGYIVSANHVNNSVRIGQILITMKAINRQILEQALSQQENAGNDRKPLIATLIESGQLSKEDAYTGLETLIEMSIVEVLTWTKGTFSLDVHSTVVSDEYRYFPETLKQEIFLNTQSILMDALRIYDEKMRDGTLDGGAFSSSDVPPLEQQAAAHVAPVSPQSNHHLTIEDLGLEDLDTLEKKIPDVFGGLKVYDIEEIHRQKIREAAGHIPPLEHEQLFNFLMEYSGTAPCRMEPSTLAVIIFSQDNFVKHCLTTVCKHEGIFAFTTDESENLDLIIEQSLSKGLVPLMVMDAPQANSGFSADKLISLLQLKLDRFPQLVVLQLISPYDHEYPLKALQAGARSVLARASQENSSSFAIDTITFLSSFREYIKKSVHTAGNHVLRQFKDCIFELGTLKEVPEVAFIPLKFASTMFERCITFVIGTNEIIAERSIGIKAEKSAGASSPLLFRIPLSEPSIFQNIVQNGSMFYGLSSDNIIKNNLFEEIGVPLQSKILLLPIKNFGRVIAVLYADFGSKPSSPVQIDLLDIIARHAGLVLDNNLFRKKFEKAA